MPVIQNSISTTGAGVTANVFTQSTGGASRYQFVNNGTRLIIAVGAADNTGSTLLPSSTALTYNFSVNNVIYAEDAMVPVITSGEGFTYNSPGYRLHEVTLTGSGAGRNELFLIFTATAAATAFFSIYVSPQFQ
jgi:predicted DNA-binding helix-hairpin-helix protein